MHILIIGTTPTGIALSKILSQGGHAITLVGEVHHTPGSIRVADQLTAALEFDQPFNWIAFAQKSYETVPAIFELQKQLSDRIPPVATFQSGVGNVDSLRSAFGPDLVAAGHLSASETHLKRGRRGENSPEMAIVAGDSPAASVVRSAFEAANCPIFSVERADSLEWSRLFVQLTGNATAAILDMAPADVLRDTGLFGIEWLALTEARWVIDRLGVPLIDLPGLPAATLARWLRRRPQWILRPQLINHVRRTWGSDDPPLLAGLRAGEKKSESAWFNGAVVMAARSIDYLAPVNHMLSLLVSDIVSGRTAWYTFRRQSEMLHAALRTVQHPPPGQK